MTQPETPPMDPDMMDTDDNISVSSNNENFTAASNKLIDEVDDEGFFDKPAVSPSESGASTPPPSSDPETLSSQEESSFLSPELLNAT